MINKELLLKTLRLPCTSEKVSAIVEKNNIIVLKVDRSATKSEIKIAVYYLFEVEVIKVRTLIVKGKVKRHGKNIGCRVDWKKAYISLKKGQNLDFISKEE